MISKAHKSALKVFSEQEHRIKLFASTVLQFFVSHPSLSTDVHSVKLRIKNKDNLLGKLKRKKELGVAVSEKNIFKVITDLAGVRVFHIHAAQFKPIHDAIMTQVKSGDWVLGEDPKVFSWDPEADEFFRGLGFDPEIRPTFYTSVHYLVRPSAESDLCCEIQVRTLFEEIWGEVDHSMNYPRPVQSIACREQLRALSKLVGTGGRLVDSIIRSRAEADTLNASLSAVSGASSISTNRRKSLSSVPK
ncbi:MULTISPECIES: RelA/SpoT domain-containing protein [Xanthomonas]|uniref:RelA/SpoT domain-containing protein n=1 Tax=Xanthomonas TaxID=338 RepID=UPI00161DB4C2|nr:RelA/SpoT domain-containing protein [Xanthomonas arboricola]MBB4728103.1 ppGpp synthetase/RelA/SpoT-type nucleotidyltransferase [Xanthomonas arboricola]